VEKGAVQRGNKVIYDRTNSAFANIEPNLFNWKKIFSDACWFHWTGITPALSKGIAEATLEAVNKAKELGLTVSCDLNYRSKLWKWGKAPEEVMSELMKCVDVLIGNEEDAEKIFGIKAPGVDVAKGKVKAEDYVYVAEKLMKRFSNINLVNITLRGSISASHNTWSAVSYNGKKLYVAPIYDITHIVDRIGGGDSFAAGLIYNLLSNKKEIQKALNFAVAASCLKHTVHGDFMLVNLDEIKKLIKGVVSGRISR
jgi:2-dehydro-3-deoxygluconokinase